MAPIGDRRTAGSRRLRGLGETLSGQAWQALLAEGTARRFVSGHVLLRQGDPGTHVYVLTAGHVKVVRVEADGSEILLAVRGLGEILGEMAVLDGAGRSATLIALGPCVAYAVPAGRFRRFIHQHELRDTIIRLMLSRYREAEEIRVQLAKLPAFERVVRVLLRLADAMDGPAHATPGLSQEELASAAGLSRSAVAAELAELRRLGVITTARRRIVILDRERLGAPADSIGEIRGNPV